MWRYNRGKRKGGHMAKQNCWEFKNCGREDGGAKVFELGVCPSATEKSTNGTNSGKNGGRACWAVAGTLCGGKVQGSFIAKVGNCMKCEFYLKVIDEEGGDFVTTSVILEKLKAK
jgi:hypothetical protein